MAPRSSPARRRTVPAGFAGVDLFVLGIFIWAMPTFGNISYAHGWVTGAFLAPGREPLFVLPRMFAVFHLGGSPPDERDEYP